MKTLERTLCPACEEELRAARLVYKKLPGTEGSCKCEWCGKVRYCTRYQIVYGREKA